MWNMRHISNCSGVIIKVNVINIRSKVMLRSLGYFSWCHLKVKYKCHIYSLCLLRVKGMAKVWIIFVKRRVTDWHTDMTKTRCPQISFMGYKIWNAKLTETHIFRELSIEIESYLIELKSSLIQLKSSLIQLESSLIQLESSLIHLLSSLYMYNKRAH